MWEGKSTLYDEPNGSSSRRRPGPSFAERKTCVIMPNDTSLHQWCKLDTALRRYDVPPPQQYKQTNKKGK